MIGIVKRTGNIFSFRMLVILNYIVTNVASGVVHLSVTSTNRRGYFDALQWLRPEQILQVVALQLLGLIAVCSGALWGLSRGAVRSNNLRKTLSRRDHSSLPVLVGVILPLSLWATLKIREYASRLDIDRVIAVAGGMARFNFVSHWLIWAISLGALWYIFRGRGKHGLPALVVLIAGILAIATSLEWTGGRSIIIVMALPLVLVVWPRLNLSPLLAVPVGLTILLLYLNQLTVDRYASLRAAGSGVIEWLDWEWGRFSMMGFGVQHAEQHGLLMGETYVGGLARFFDGILRLSGFPSLDLHLRSSMGVAAESILHSSSEIYIVPGMSSELYMNFGFLGIAVGYFILGRLSGWVDDRFAGSVTVTTQLAWSYVGTLLVFRTVNADSASVLHYLFYSGAPLIVAALLSHWSARRERAGGYDGSSKAGKSSSRDAAAMTRVEA